MEPLRIACWKFSAWLEYYSLHYLGKSRTCYDGWELLMLKLKEDLYGTTQDSWLEKVILHGLNIISPLFGKILYVLCGWEILTLKLNWYGTTQDG